MKRIFWSTLFLLISLGIFSAGTFFGKKETEEKLNLALVIGSETRLALLLEVFNELEKGEQVKALWLLQTSTAGELETVIDYGKFEGDSQTTFRCAVLSRYKKYYSEKQIFKTKEWANLMQVQGMQDAANKRDQFFEVRLPLLCPKKRD